MSGTISNMFEAYRGFFTASTGASAAFIGLLFVALSFIQAEQVPEATRLWRRIIANSAFSQLVNVFFVSLAGLLPSRHSFAIMCCVMGALGTVVAFRLLPQTTAREETGRSTPTALGLIATGTYLLELAIGICLLVSSNGQTFLPYAILAVLILYAGALARAWEITGFKHRR